MHLRRLFLLTAASAILFVGPVALGFALLRFGYDAPALAYLAGFGAIALGVSLTWTVSYLLRRVFRRE